MGNDISLQKSRSVDVADMTLQIRNNYHPLHFHQVHGDNVKLINNRTIARRHEGFCKGIAFSDRPVVVYEPVCIKFVDISTNWSGALRIGFTNHDPATMKYKLPRYACPDLTSIHGNWAKAIAERMAKKDSVLYYYVDQNGDVHYGLDSEELGIFFGGVDTSGKLWAVLDIYGNTLAVEFLEPIASQDCINESQSNLISLPTNNESQRLGADYLHIPSSAFHLAFHFIHGNNILLKPNRHVASRKPGSSSHAYVFTERPLKLNEKIVMKVVETDQYANGSLVYGITSCNPSTLLSINLPENAEDLVDRPEYWVVRQDSNSYKSDDHIIYSISDEGEVVVMKNHQKYSIFHVDPTQPLWLFLNLIGTISEVHLIGSSVSDEIDILRKLDNLTVSLPPKTYQKDSDPGPSSQHACTECVICYEEPVNCALYRCGHMCMCYKCASQMWKPNSNVQCPICRKPIQDIIKIYI